MNNENNIFNDFIDSLATKVVEKMREEGLATTTVADEDSAAKARIPKLFTREEVCEMARVSAATLDRHRKMGLIVASHYVGSSPRFTEVDVKRYMNRGGLDLTA